MKSRFSPAALTVHSAALIGSAYAAEVAADDAMATANAKIDLTRAVSAAEQHGVDVGHRYG